MRLTILTALLPPLVLAASLSGAEERPHKKLTLTYDPLLVTMQTFQAAVEYRPVPRWSGSLLFGGGASGEEASYFRSSFTGSWWHVGAQARWYPDSPGGIAPHAFAHAVWERVRYDEYAQQTRGAPSQADLGVAASGWGWKFTHRKGFVLDAQLGLAALWEKDANASPLRVMGSPYVNLGVGWSFF